MRAAGQETRRAQRQLALYYWNVYENRLGHVAHPPSGVQFRQ